MYASTLCTVHQQQSFRSGFDVCLRPVTRTYFCKQLRTQFKVAGATVDLSAWKDCRDGVLQPGPPVFGPKWERSAVSRVDTRGAGGDGA